MRVGVLGAGAMGTLWGCMLAKTGHDVHFFSEWPVLINHVREHPIAILHYPDHDEEVPVKLTATCDAPEEAFDLMIIMVKSAGTQKAIENASNRHLISDTTVVLTCQGGFENPQIIARHMSNPEHLLSGCTTSFSKSRGLMEIEKFGIRRTTVWPHGYDSHHEPSQRVKDVVKFLADAGMMVELTPEAITDRWKMLLFYPTNIAVSAILHLPFGVCWETRECRELLTSLAKECALVAKVENIDEQYFNEEIAIKAVEQLAIEGPEHAGSMLTDVKLKRITEIDGTSGALLRVAEEHGFDLPLTRAIWAILRTTEQNYGKEV